MRKREESDIVQLSKIRIRERLRAKIEKEAEHEGTTLNAIIARRLERSDAESEALGGVTMHSAFLAMADIARSQSSHRGVDWLQDRELFDLVLREWTLLMRRLFRPPAKASAENASAQPPANEAA